jgi:hypothetical protein
MSAAIRDTVLRRNKVVEQFCTVKWLTIQHKKIFRLFLSEPFAFAFSNALDTPSRLTSERPRAVRFPPRLPCSGLGSY